MKKKAEAIGASYTTDGDEPEAIFIMNRESDAIEKYDSDKKELKEYLKKNLRLSTSVESQAYGCSGSINISLMLEGEKIDSAVFDGSEIDSTVAQDYDG